MRVVFRNLYGAAVLLALAGSAMAANTIAVPGDVATIQGAINLALNGDTVLVSDGTYAENVNFLGKAITVTSVNGAAATTIDGGAAASVVTFATGETANSILSGFTIRNGKASGGGGVRISGASPVVRNNIIRENLVDFSGGGISVTGGAALIENNQITLNRAASGGSGMELAFTGAVIRGNSITLNTPKVGSTFVDGGGIYVRGAGTVQISDNLIAQNSAGGGDGGGIGLFAAGDPVIRNNIIRNNSAGDGGGISHANESDSVIVQNLIYGNTATGKGGGIEWLVPSGDLGPRLLNNTIANNSALSGSGLFADGFDKDAVLINNIIVAAPGQTAVTVGNFNDANAPMFFNNDLYSSGGAAYAGIGVNPIGFNGNVSLDALFVDAPNGNLRLLGTSSLIDIGDNSALGLPLFDLDGNPRIVDGNLDASVIVDLGAYELVPEPSTIALFLSGVAAWALVARKRTLRLRSR
jgi:hypothetical protein